MTKKEMPSLEEWLREAKEQPESRGAGMYLFHNGVVRETAKAYARNGVEEGKAISGMRFSYDQEKVEAAVERARKLPGITHIRVWLNEGLLSVGDDIMLVLVGGDIRPRVIEALQSLVQELKEHCVGEEEIREEA